MNNWSIIKYIQILIVQESLCAGKFYLVDSGYGNTPKFMEIAIILVPFVEVIGDILVRKICSIIFMHSYGMLLNKLLVF